MVQIAGTYQHVETFNPQLFLKVIGLEVSDENLTTIQSLNVKLIVEVSGDNYSFLGIVGDSWKRETKFTLGKAFEEQINTTKITTIVTKEGDKFIFKSTSVLSSGERTYEFTDAGVTFTINVAGEKAKRVYKRV